MISIAGILLLLYVSGVAWWILTLSAIYYGGGGKNLRRRDWLKLFALTPLSWFAAMFLYRQ